MSNPSLENAPALPEQQVGAPRKHFLMVGGGCEPKARNAFASEFIEMGQLFKGRGWETSALFADPNDELFETVRKDYPVSASYSFGPADIETFFTRLENLAAMPAQSQLLIVISTHGSPKYEFASAHRICMGNGQRLSMDSLVLRKRLTLLKERQIQVAIVDQSCYSGGSVEAIGNLACVLSTQSESRPSNAAAFILHLLRGHEQLRSMSDVHVAQLFSSRGGQQPQISGATDSNQAGKAFLDMLSLPPYRHESNGDPWIVEYEKLVSPRKRPLQELQKLVGDLKAVRPEILKRLEVKVAQVRIPFVDLNSYAFVPPVSELLQEYEEAVAKIGANSEFPFLDSVKSQHLDEEWKLRLAANESELANTVVRLVIDLTRVFEPEELRLLRPEQLAQDFKSKFTLGSLIWVYGRDPKFIEKADQALEVTISDDLKATIRISLLALAKIPASIGEISMNSPGTSRETTVAYDYRTRINELGVGWIKVELNSLALNAERRAIILNRLQRQFHHALTSALDKDALIKITRTMRRFERLLHGLRNYDASSDFGIDPDTYTLYESMPLIRAYHYLLQLEEKSPDAVSCDEFKL